MFGVGIIIAVSVKAVTFVVDSRADIRLPKETKNLKKISKNGYCQKHGAICKCYEHIVINIILQMADS